MFHLAGPCGDLQTEVVEQVEVEECDHFLSFAKRSRTVQRQCSVEAPLCPTAFLQPKASVQYNQEFWDRILQWPSSQQTEACSAGAVGMVGGAAERRPSLGLRRGQGAELGKDSLPTPSELFRRRRARGGRGGGAQRGDVMQRGVATVLQHMRDLKRRQRSIDQLKTERCWGFLAGSRPEETGVVGPVDPLQDQRPCELSPAQGCGPSTSPTPLRCTPANVQPAEDVWKWK
ncbi:hypothetical protein SKAU_G00325260 [Synaphobranchus kaupii]|uniref:Uncharacterized protein n=1 Tax=Synaphobranchus kaupii TaxID=118154 RepID=A0A9Q1II23_SYNKA|nr:hypothetical protein SKAU_G00325260 [Synaphobranchus kaupii]